MRERIVVVEAPRELQRLKETVRSAGVREIPRPGCNVSEAGELFTLVFDDITNLRNNEPYNALTMIQAGPSRDRYSDFGDLAYEEQWHDFDDAYRKFSLQMFAEVCRKIGTDPDETIVYERHASNCVVFSVYSESKTLRRYNDAAF